MSIGNVIEIRALTKSYGDKFTLGPIDLNVPRGAIFGLIGPNGAGKTTAIDLMMNIGIKGSGTISLFGLQHRHDEVAIKQKIGYVSPDINFIAWRKVNRVLHYFRKFYPDWDDAYCQTLMEKLDVNADEKIRNLSFGAKIKLNLVVAMSHRPELLILDEPTLGLDAVARHEVFSELLKSVQDEDRTVLISSHGLADIERFADHIGFIKNGCMLLDGETSSLVNRFQQYDFDALNGAPSQFPSGIYPQSSENDRVQVVVDSHASTDEWLGQNGLRKISNTPMTLEDIFVALARD